VVVLHSEEARSLWGLDYSKLIVNHGSYGATPLEVLAAQDDWRRQMEAAPTLFMQLVLDKGIRGAATAVGAAIGGRGEDIALVDNATAGANAILGSLPFQPGDEILVHSHLYGALLRTARHIAARTGAVIVTAEIPFPDVTAAAITAAFANALTPRTRLVMVDHVTSPTALIFPLADIIAVCRAANVPVLVDGAHGPGQVPIDVSTLGAAYYLGNGHKWWMGAKGVGFLWAAPEYQKDLHPTIISWGYGGGFIEEFDWTGTRDWSAALSLPTAIDFHTRLGGPELMAANAKLAREAAAKLADRFRTRLGAPDLHAAMTMVELPFSGEATDDRAMELRKLFFELGCDIPISALAGKFWMRLSAAAYNFPSDFDRLGDLIDMIGQRQV
jgi:isopenicillin-N epimerase